MDLRSIILEPARVILQQAGGFISAVITIIFILVIGWLVAKLAQNLVVRMLKIIRLDALSRKIGVENFLTKGGIRYTLAELIGILVYWLLLLVTFMVAVNAVGLTATAGLLDRVVMYIPNVIASIFILILGMFFATFLSSMVQATASNAGIGQAKILAKIAEVVVVIFAIAIALEQLNIGARIIAVSINIILASFGLAIAIAFGVGCKDIAAKSVEDFLDKIKKK